MFRDLLDPQKANKRLDKHVCNKIDEYLEKHDPKYNYSLDDLNKKVNDDETLLEYIRDSEKEFGLEEKKLTDENLNSYIKKLDIFWEVL